MTDVYFFDDFQTLVKVANEHNLFEVTQEREITTNKSDLMNDKLTVVVEYDIKIKEASYMAVRENESLFSMYRIMNISETDERLTFTGVNFAPDELDSYIVKDLRPKNEKFEDFAIRLLDATEGEWTISSVSQALGTVTGTFYYVSVKEALKILQGIGCEITFRIAIEGSKIVGKYIDFYEQIGELSNTRYEYGKNALEVVKEIEKSNVYTSLIGRGKGEEVGDGYGRRIEFTDVAWTSPLNKPKGQNWLEDTEMTAIYGIPTKNGGMRKREKVVIFEDIEDPEELLQATYKALIETNRPLVQFRSSVVGTEKIGNTVTIHRYDRDYHYQTRVFKTKVDLLTGKGEISIGDQLTSSLTRQTSNIQSGLSTLEEKKMTFYQSTEIGKYQDDIMRGAGKNGGSIYLVNGIEAGVSNSREPYEQVYMDAPSIEQSQHFMIQNSEGISFKKCNKGEWKTIQDVHNGSSRTAWTIESILNADFIRAGVLSGILVEGTVIKTADTKDFQIVLVGGSLRFQQKKETVVVEKDGKQVYDYAGKDLAFMTATYDNDTKKANGVAIVQQVGQIFSLNTTNSQNTGASSYVVQIPAESTSEAPKLNLRGEINILGSLKINGVAVGVPGTGSAGDTGGWNGNYPSIADTQAKKFAWEAWTTLRGLGYSESAAAGILGNINGEAGPSMNPDTDQVGGPAYGAVQFDGSAYPLIGSPTNDGREYFQRLHKASNVGGDYKTMSVQMAVVNWTMTNGQWIGQINPTTVSGYKAMTDARTAATVFERNFERPASTHPERSNYAQTWYDLFKGVAIEKKDWVNPIRIPYMILQEWNQIGWGTNKIHGGIDITPKNGASSSVYAARTGVVHQIVPNDENGGNYIVVKHSDNYYTYYGHLASMRVKVGDNVNTDTVLGMSGQTGRATGIHLHFEVWKGGEWQRINPRDVIKF